MNYENLLILALLRHGIPFPFRGALVFDLFPRLCQAFHVKRVHGIVLPHREISLKIIHPNNASARERVYEIYEEFISEMKTFDMYTLSICAAK